MAAPRAPDRSDVFLNIFGTPALLWRVLNHVGYIEPPRYTWTQEYIGQSWWYRVKLTILARIHMLLWREWTAETESRNPWEGAQVVALEILN